MDRDQLEKIVNVIEKGLSFLYNTLNTILKWTVLASGAFMLIHSLIGIIKYPIRFEFITEMFFGAVILILLSISNAMSSE